MTNVEDEFQIRRQELNKSQLKQLAESSWIPPDGGWGWMCVFVCFATFALVVGMSRSFGVIYDDVMEAFPGTKHTVLVMVPSMVIVLTVGLGAIAGALTVAFSIRSIVFIGGLLSGIGLSLNFFATNVYYMMFCFFIAGIGTGLTTNPGLMIVSKYFRKRRTQAVGLSLAGTGIGSMIQPLLIYYLNDIFGFRGALLILGGILFHVCAGALLYRDPIPLSKLRQFAAIRAAQVEEAIATDNIFAERAQYSTTKSNACFRWVERYLYLDLKLLYSPVFVLMCISTMFFSTNYPQALFIVPSHAKMLGFDKIEADVLLSVASAGDLIGRLASGFFFDRDMINKTQAYIIATMLFSVTLIIVAFSKNYYVIATSVFLYGCFAGSSLILVPVLLSEHHGASKVASSIGIARSSMAITCLLGSPISGHLRDITGNFQASLVVLSGISAFASVCIFLMYVPRLHRACLLYCKCQSVKA